MIKKKNSNAGGVTLVEMLVIFIIFIILVAITPPLMSRLKTRYIAAEAVAGVRRVAAAERAYYNKYGKFFYVWGDDPDHPDLTDEEDLKRWPTVRKIADLPGIKPGDLNGTFFSEESYVVSWNPAEPAYPSTDDFTVHCGVLYSNFAGTTKTTNNAPRKADIEAIATYPDYYFVRLWRRYGYDEITTVNIPNSGYENETIAP